jgi:hypothetical protein
MEVDGGTPGPARILLESRSGRAVLRREQREQLESNHRGRKARSITDVTSTALGK